MLAASGKLPVEETAKTYVTWMIFLTPIVFIMDRFGVWYSDNQIFFEGFIYTMLANVVVGMIKNSFKRTFSWMEMAKKTSIMCLSIITVYIVLDVMRYTAGDNIAGEVFRIFIQITVLMWPASKILKNIYIISGGEFPPEFMMKKLYNFQTNGDLNEFFKTSNKGRGGYGYDNDNDGWVRNIEEERVSQGEVGNHGGASRNGDDNDTSARGTNWRR